MAEVSGCLFGDKKLMRLCKGAEQCLKCSSACSGKFCTLHFAVRPSQMAKADSAQTLLPSTFSILPSFVLHASNNPLLLCCFQNFSRILHVAESFMAILAVIVQYGMGTKDFIAFSRSSRNLSVGPCTLPVLSVAYCPLLLFAA